MNQLVEVCLRRGGVSRSALENSDVKANRIVSFYRMCPELARNSRRCEVFTSRVLAIRQASRSFRPLVLSSRLRRRILLVFILKMTEKEILTTRIRLRAQSLQPQLYATCAAITTKST